MATRRVKLIYPAQLVDEPVLYRMVRQFDLVTNIRRAAVEDEGGVLELEIRGDDPTITRALDWMRSLGIRVQEG